MRVAAVLLLLVAPAAAGPEVAETARPGFFLAEWLVVDVDGDTHLDVLAGSNSDDRVAWYENNGATPPSWTPHVISTAADGVNSVYAEDLDGDGDWDVWIGNQGNDEVWINQGGAQGGIVLEAQVLPEPKDRRGIIHG